MLIDFFYALKQAGLPVSTQEYLLLLEALQKRLVAPSLDELYYLARITLVKSETHYDKFDKAFGKCFGNNTSSTSEVARWFEAWKNGSAPEASEFPLQLTESAPANAPHSSEHPASRGDARNPAQTAHYAPGEGTAAGVRIGGDSRNQQARKVWEERAYRDYDTDNQLASRNMKIALRRLRKYARLGIAEEELDMDGTLKATANRAGMLDIRMRPERKNRFKVLVLLDVGGTMAEHATLAAGLLSAAKFSFRNMEFFYFHNCIYDQVWRQNWPRKDERTSTWDIIHTYGTDTRVIFVGDAKMGLTELTQAGGSISDDNEESGDVWLRRLVSAYPNFIWLNPEPEESWDYRESIVAVRNIMHNRMFPLTIDGLERGMRLLSK